MITLSCAYCGCTNLRWSRMHSPLRRLLRAWTPLRRYECGECFHKGWVVAPHREFRQSGDAEAEQTGSQALPPGKGPAPHLVAVVMGLWGAWFR
jgi:hypothetical protein